MIRNLKIGIVLAAVLAMSAIGASAQAASSLDVGAAPATLTASQGVQNKLTITDAGVVVTTVRCSTADLEATTTTTNVTEATVTPNYGAAKMCELGGIAASVTVNGCKYTLKGTATALTWTADVVCPAGKVIEIEQGTCVITVASQANLGTITFANVAVPPKHVTATLNIKGISVTGGLGCPANLQGVKTADLTGTQTVKAFKDEVVEGAQVNLEAT